jgi:serine/threonine-protein kinase HipA
MDKKIEVYFQDATGSDLHIGELSARALRGKETFSFEAAAPWIRQAVFRDFDPDLGQFSGPQYLRDEKSNFGIFLDSAPDRWGRLLLRRREALLAREENRTARTLLESDCLLGVFDGNRTGALRFKLEASGNFLDDHADLAAPPLAKLRELEQASLHLEAENAPDQAGYSHWLQMLLAPGSSLGGARPKANVLDPQGNLWIAKFPSRNDTLDQGAWEAVTAELARRCGITMAETQTLHLGRKGHTFLSRRFDRNGKQRIHFTSAMTLLGYQDGTQAADGASYLEIAEVILRKCSNVQASLRELWRRIVFSIAVSNTDDHLRNHGFLLSPEGWTLSPAYDINPNPEGTGLTLNISETDNALDFELALSVAPYFRISTAEAREIITDTRKTVSGWRPLAKAIGISRQEQESIAPAFRE